MTLQWPAMLLSLLVLPLLVVWYRGLLRRRAARRAELASLGLVAPGMTPEPAGAGRDARPADRRRQVAPVLFLVALGVLLVGLSRPEATIDTAHREGTVILAFDVSGSMAATDLTPNRLAAAKAAARSFVERQPSTVRVGVVAFGADGLIVQPPTSDKGSVLAAVDRLTPLGGTSIARGILSSLSAIVGKPVQLTAPNAGAASGQGGVEAQGQDLGYHGSSAVIMLSDGENTEDPDPLAAAQLASAAGVKIYPVGLGSPQGTVLRIDGFLVATKLDETLLRQLATSTDGTYYPATSSQQLTAVYQSINPTWTVQARRVEITALFAGAAALLLVIGAALSIAWYGRVI